MKIAKLRSALELFPKMDPAWASDDGKTALAALDKLLSNSHDRTIVEFCSAAKISKPKAARKSKPAPQVSAQLIADYVAALKSSTTDQSLFQEVMQRMKKDKSVRLPEANAIAAAFAGSPSALKTKRDAFRIIEQRRIADARSSTKRERISDLF